MCASMAPAVRISPSPAMASVVTPTIMSLATPGITSGLPALPMPAIRPFLIPTSAFRIPVQSMIRALVITAVERCLVSNTCRLPHAVTENLAGTEHALVAIRRIVPFHFRDERGVGEMNAIAGGRTIQVDVVTTIDAAAHWSSWC